MKISTKGRYALRVMIYLAINNNGTYITTKEIAKNEQISNKYLEQIISLLNKAGYLDNKRGNTGGYRLSKEPKDYNVGDILRATERDLSPLYCIKEGCNRKTKCKSYSFWKGLDDTITRYVDSKTLEDLIN